MATAAVAAAAAAATAAVGAAAKVTASTPRRRASAPADTTASTKIRRYRGLHHTAWSSIGCHRYLLDACLRRKTDSVDDDDPIHVFGYVRIAKLYVIVCSLGVV